MGLGLEDFNGGALNVDKSKSKKKKDGESGVTGCWIKFRFIGGCLSSSSKTDGANSGTSTQYGISNLFLFIVSSYNGFNSLA